VFVVFERLRKDRAPDQPTHGNGSGVVAGEYSRAVAHEPVEVK